jgi:Putative zinc-finger
MSDWHVSTGDLSAWVEGDLGSIGAASVEQHLVACSRCRAAVGGAVPTAPLEAVWDSIRGRIESPQLNLVGRVLVRVGMPEGNALLISSAPSLSGPWIAGVVMALVFAVLAANSTGTRGIVIYLIIAPSAPLVGIAAAFGRVADPLYELAVASPYPKFQLLLWRSATVLATTIPIALLAVVPLDVPWWVGGAWLVPAAALVAITLSLSNVFAPQWTALGAAGGWFTINLLALAAGEPLAAVSSRMFVIYALFAAAAATSATLPHRDRSPRWRNL